MAVTGRYNDAKNDLLHAIWDQLTLINGKSVDLTKRTSRAGFSTVTEDLLYEVLQELTEFQGNYNARILGWVLAQSFRVVVADRDSYGAITTASIVWPDGKTGVFTTLVVSSNFLGAIDSYQVTYVNGLNTKTYTQPSVTRDSTGAITAQPSIIIS